MRPIYLISKTPYKGVIHIPILKISYRHITPDFSLYQGIVFTSKEAVNALKYIKGWQNLPCICVSKPTAEYAASSGAICTIVAEGYGESIGNKIMEFPTSFRWYYPRPEAIASSWPDQVRSMGIDVTEEVAYQTLCNTELSGISIERDAVLIFTSPSSIECFLKQFEILSEHKIVVIGKTTQSALPACVQSWLSDERSVESAVNRAKELSSGEIL